jgi:hypothetical protein
MIKPVNDIEIVAIARLAGLRKAVEQFPDDVLAAARAAAQVRMMLSLPKDPTVEPWPPMHTSHMP